MIRQILGSGLLIFLTACSGGGGNSSDTSSSTFSSTSSSNSTSSPTSNVDIATFAGNAYGPGNINGTGSAAWFNSPHSMVADASGNLYVADTGNNVIRKITPNGVVTIFAGSATEYGSADGSLTTARFDFPTGLAIDASGNLYVADMGNYTIRKITTSGNVITLAGVPGQQGILDGTGARAWFMSPVALAVGTTGIIYVADNDSLTIRTISPTGDVTTLAGRPGYSGRTDGNTLVATFNEPNGIAVDSGGNVYVADDFPSCAIRKITPDYMVTTLAGGTCGSTDGTGTSASFRYPTAITLDSNGNLLVTDGNAIRRVSMAGVVTTIAGTANTGGSNDGNALAAHFLSPYGITTDTSGNIYVADSSNQTIRKITTAGDVTTVAGTAREHSGSADGKGIAAAFRGPIGLTSDSQGNLYLTDSDNNTIRKISPDGVVTTLAGTAGIDGATDGSGGTASFNYPTSIAADTSGNLYVTEVGNSTIRKITPAGAVTTIAGKPNTTGFVDGIGEAARFNSPDGIAVSSTGNIYVSDSANNSIRMITPDGTVTTVNSSSFNFPCEIAFDSMGNLYVADSGNHRIAKMAPDGSVTTFAGKMGVKGSTDGVGTAATFFHPFGVAFDTSGNLYVTDRWNNTIRKVTSAGVVTTIAGQPGISGFDTTSPGILYQPWGITVVGNTIYTAMNNGIVSITPTN